MLNGERIVQRYPRRFTHSVQLMSWIKAPSDRVECGLKSRLCTWYWAAGRATFYLNKGVSAQQSPVFMTHFFSDLHKATEGSHVSCCS